jgi:hypothetical protein
MEPMRVDGHVWSFMVTDMYELVGEPVRVDFQSRPGEVAAFKEWKGEPLTIIGVLVVGPGVATRLVRFAEAAHVAKGVSFTAVFDGYLR